MLLRSTYRSVKEKQPTGLAIFETALASCGAIWVCWQYDILWHLAIATALAPFLLLRTKAAEDLSLRLAETYFESDGVRRPPRTHSRFWRLVWIAYIRGIMKEHMLNFRQDVFLITVVLPLMLLLTFASIIWELLLFFVIRVAPLVYTLFRHPLETLSAIPENWRRVVLCTDIFTPAEILPGINEFSSNKNTPILDKMRISTIKKAMDNAKTETQIEGLITVQLMVQIPALAYRYSVKSTAVIWSPLVWIFRPILIGENPVEYARGIRDLGYYKMARMYSFVVLAFIILKLYLFLFWMHLAKHVDGLPGWNIAEAYLAPQHIPMWQVAALINSLLTIIIYMRATTYIHLHEHNRKLPNQMRQFFQASFYLRNLLAIYTSLCVSYISIVLVTKIKLPPLKAVWFPW